MTANIHSPEPPNPDLLPLIRSGFVAVVGRPNAGKSTLINALVGAKVSIVTPVPQTTRNRILGIANRPGAQVVFMDTPGIHKPLSRLNQQMMSFVRQALQDRDLTVLIVDASQPFGRGDEYALNLLKEHASRAILALNKIDTMSKTRLLPLIDRYSKLHAFEEVFPISALRRDGLEDLLQAVIRLLPEGPAYFPPDTYTDQPERFLAGELIREQVIRHTRQELPYVSAVLVEEFKESETMTTIRAAVVVEKESQRPIVLGASGTMIKGIGTAARTELEKLFPPKVFLELFVKVQPHWRDNPSLVHELDYRETASG
jgi:GTP-binding protein Era